MTQTAVEMAEGGFHMWYVWFSLKFSVSEYDNQI